MVDTSNVSGISKNHLTLEEAAERRSHLAARAMLVAQGTDAEGGDAEEHKRLARQVKALEMAMAQSVSSVFEAVGSEAQVQLFEDLASQLSTRKFIESSKKLHKERSIGYM